MKFQVLMLFAISPAFLCHDINNIFININEKAQQFNAKAAEIAWETSINPGNPNIPVQAEQHQKQRIKWEEETCDSLAILHKSHLLNDTQLRQTYLLCRGPKYNFKEARRVSQLYEELQIIYSDAEICIPSSKNITIENVKDLEGTILSYLTKVKHFAETKHLKDNNYITLAAKIAGNENVQQNGLCLQGEEDFEKVMELSKNEKVLEWIWTVWREKVGPPMKTPYRLLVDVENAGALRNGYKDIGECWRDELEIPHLRKVCRSLYEEVKPLYTLLHGVVRFYLRRRFGDIVPKRGPIPAHLLGNLWSQNWEPLADLILSKNIDLNQSIKKLNWTVMHMAKRAEDFYQSLGLPAMSDTFWRESVFTRRSKETRCHGAAADMYKDGDFRLLYCSGNTKEDFYVLHHEMGHIHYYMAYEKQPAIFRQANSAFHETVGDAIMYGVMTPQHLHRLGLINDSLLYVPTNDQETRGKIGDIDIKEQRKGIIDFQEWRYDMNIRVLQGFEKLNDGDEKYTMYAESLNDLEESFFESADDILLLKQALNKIPQIPFSLLIDEYRWKYFEGNLTRHYLNQEFWQIAMDLQGIAPPTKRGEEYFDIGAKFHVPDNTPYIRYFLSSFLQLQLFESLCKAAVFGRRDARDSLPSSITLNRCDIYGSKSAGKLLKDLMSRGHSQHWREILQKTTGEDNISASALKRYYRPLYNKLLKLVNKYSIPIGWETFNQK